MMDTLYIRFVQAAEDPVWGTQALSWAQTDLVRVTRNRLKKAVFEWVGNPTSRFDLEQIRRSYPIVMYADLPNSGDWIKSLGKAAIRISVLKACDEK